MEATSSDWSLTYNIGFTANGLSDPDIELRVDLYFDGTQALPPVSKMEIYSNGGDIAAETELTIRPQSCEGTLYIEDSFSQDLYIDIS